MSNVRVINNGTVTVVYTPHGSDQEITYVGDLEKCDLCSSPMVYNDGLFPTDWSLTIKRKMDLEGVSTVLTPHTVGCPKNKD